MVSRVIAARFHGAPPPGADPAVEGRAQQLIGGEDPQPADGQGPLGGPLGQRARELVQGGGIGLGSGGIGRLGRRLRLAAGDHRQAADERGDDRDRAMRHVSPWW
jgi:hypothetical protein